MNLKSSNNAKLTILCLFVFSSAIIGPSWAKDPIEKTGDILLIALPASAVGLATYNFAFNKDKNGIVQYGIAALLNEGVTFALKNSVHELRPNHHDYLSFPSGHSSTTFTAATFMWKRYGWEYGLPAFALASFTAYSRVESRNHYIQDVGAGAALGILSSLLFTKPFHKVKIEPVTIGKGIGVVASVSF